MLLQTKDMATFENIQALYLKTKHNMSAQAVSQIAGFRKGHI